MASQTERQVGNWLAGYLAYTEDTESPENYHVWCALSCLASVVRRNVWLDQGHYILFPNLYIGLVGPPARTAKSTAIRMGRRLISGIPGVVLGPDACSREQLIRAMASAKLNDSCAMTVHSTEFSSIVDTSGIMMIQFLTDIYDCDYNNPKGWRYETKHQGKDEIKNPFLNMLVGTTASYLSEAMPDSIVGHGFTSRMIFVYEDKERKEIPIPTEPDPQIMAALIHDLGIVTGLSGGFTWTAEGREAYTTFYHKLFKTIPADHRIEGYHWRKKIHVLKTAMLLSMAERDELILDAAVINTAIQLLDSLEAKMSKVFSAVGKYEHASDVERIGTQIIQSGGMPMSDMFRRNYFSGSEMDLRQMLASLLAMRTIKIEKREGVDWLVPTTNKLPWES